MTSELIFDAVKRDNLSAFAELAKKNRGVLSLCFGRFPLLSLCYLFKSRKIVKHFEKRLNDIVEFSVVDEPNEAYQRFKTVAKKNLRFFVFAEDKTVSPLEMLAVVKDFYYLEDAFPRLRKTPKVKETVCKILQNDDFSVTQKGNDISVSHKPLTRLQKITLPLIFVLCFVFVAFPLTAFAVFGNGTEGNPVKISSVETFLQIFSEQEKHFKLTSDLDLTGVSSTNDFLANLDGDGHRLTLSLDAPLVNELKGQLKNLEIVFSERQETTSITGSRAFVVNTNSGTVSNVSFSLFGDFAVNSESDTTVAVLVLDNKGEISNSTAFVDLTLHGVVAADTAFSVFAGENSGTVTDCVLVENSKISADTVDLAGLVSKNNENGTVKNSTNFAEISQVTSSDSWNPLIGGIVMQNFGTVSGCFNFGKLSARSTALNSGNISLLIAVGGISAYNFGTLVRCKNLAEIFTESVNTMIFAGGVAGGNGSLETYGDFTSIIDNCGSIGRVTVNASVEFFYVFGGGIAGYSTGLVKSSFSSTEFETSYAHAFLGGVIGLGAYFVSITGTVVTQNSGNAFVTFPNVTLSMGELAFSMSIGMEEGFREALDEFEAVQMVGSLEQLKQLPIFWE